MTGLCAQVTPLCQDKGECGLVGIFMYSGGYFYCILFMYDKLFSMPVCENYNEINMSAGTG